MKEALRPETPARRGRGWLRQMEQRFWWERKDEETSKLATAKPPGLARLAGLECCGIDAPMMAGGCSSVLRVS